MDDSRTVEAAKGVIASLFASQRTLKALAPEYRWAGLGNLLGDFGEFIAERAYGLQKAAAGSSGFDAKTADGLTVQVKTNHAAGQIGFRGEADLMLVLHVRDDGSWEELYYGPFAPVKEASSYSSRDNKQMIGVSKLKLLKAALEAAGPQAAEILAAALPASETPGNAEE